MKKLLLATGIVAAMAVPACANPFSDVASDHWAYDAIDKLAENGVVAGYPDGSYKGNRTMTRYEMAEFTARAMAYSEAEDARISAENKAMIDKLAAEFGAELDALGVRVAALEDRVGNVKFTGDARLRYINENFDGVPVKGESDKRSRYQYRVRLNASAKVNDNVSVNARLVTWNGAGSNIDLAKADGTATEARFDHYNVKYQNKHVTLIVGRDDAYLGQGTIIDDNLLGAQLIVPFGNENQYHFAAIGGRLDKWDLGYYALGEVGDMNLIAAELAGRFGKFSAGVDFGQVKSKNKEFNNSVNNSVFANGKDKMNVFGANLAYDFNDKYTVWTEYVKTNSKLAIVTHDSNVSTAKDSAWLIGVKGQPSQKFGFDVTYGFIGGGAVVAGISTWTDGLDNRIFDGGVRKAEMWKVGLNYKLMKGVAAYMNYWNVNNKDSTIAWATSNKTKSNAKYQRFELGFKFKF